MPKLRAVYGKAKQVAADIEANLTKALTEGLTEPPADTVEAIKLQSILDWLSRLPETRRMPQVLELLEEGDKDPLRAVLSTKHYLTPFPREHVELLRDEAARRAHRTDMRS